ncbi:PEP-CTERM sorting domain-containing protein [Phormidium pseudopriestleyi FRX01]|uniref:PEP-CTERM sorting domain-containing protein n=1 Tax=Phormidium pseudopriestleyi FRX01 TaxID=1759528 RepID=A0ABS3FUX1_9CYAN|nr:PEP-CTERM sorting domain-containing protein [Phormidium pseudopriestleyi]MBO0350784.1 PEP-CTERM sorting domain-containing protein [Phormidium pseudopriestleyi FRX01]
MPKLFLNASKLFALSTAVISSMGLLSATEVNALTFKGKIYESPFLFLENSEIQYTLADGIFETIISSPINTFFTDAYPEFGPEPTEPLTLVPEVVTDFQWSLGRTLEPVEFGRSIFGITDAGLFLQILDPDTAPIYQNIFMSTIQAPEGMALSVCKIQACEGSAQFGGKGGYAGSWMIQTPVTESQSVPEPSAAVALGFVSALLLKRQRKTLSAQPVAIANQQ